MDTVKKDYLASIIIGAVAAVLSVIMVNNLGFQSLKVYMLAALILLIMPPAGILVARLIGRKSHSLYQFIKFAETGGLNTFVDLGILNLLILMTGLSGGIFYSIFKGTSFTVAVINSYFWNKHWVFESHIKGGVRQEKEFAKFVTVSVGGFLVNVLVASAIVFFGKSAINLTPKLMANLGAAIAFIVTMMWNFFGYKLIVFVRPKSAAAGAAAE